MRGDYSRERFQPDRHFSSVRQQQGRVALDAEWNEYTSIQDRRWRAETQDVIGACGVPSGLPDSFAVTAAGGGLAIGAGRIYVDGLLAENHGMDPRPFDPALEERYNGAPVGLDAQPYWPEAALPLPPGRHLVYIDVWSREVSYRQDGELVEPALGVDTTTREQTVWQVRVLPDIGDDVDCRTPVGDLPGWPEANGTSGARLSTATIEVDIQEDPCIIPPSGGYRGLENQLYRVEVHDAPAPGVARIKWSRDNATISASVTEVLPGDDAIRVDQVGKDDYLRFRNGDWVEILNDVRELTGQPGEMREVVVDDGALMLSFDAALPADLVADPVGNHLRVVRWDQSDGVDADGLIELADGDAVVLEAGIEVVLAFLPGSRARTGDHWCFAARTVGTSIERLDAAPPLGIHHHYCKLAIVDVDANDGIDIDDCRPSFPPLTEVGAGCCTAIVRPGEDVQAALDSLPPEGGCVCLKTGLHEIDRPLRIRGSNVLFHGESPGAVVVGRNDPQILIVGSDEFATLTDVHIEMLQLRTEVSSDEFQPLISLRRCESATIESCNIVSPFRSFNTGVLLDRCEHCRLADCDLENALTGVWVTADSTELDIADNRIRYEVQRMDEGLIAVWLMDAFGASRVEGNQVEGYLTGIALNTERPNSGRPPRSGARGSRVAGNRIRRRGLNDAGVQNAFYGIDVAAPDCEIAGNELTYSANWHVGIRIAASRARVVGNTLWSNFDDDDPLQVPLGIEHALPEGGFAVLSDCVIRENRLLGIQNGILVAGTSGTRVTGNVLLPRGGNATIGIGISATSRVTVDANLISEAGIGVLAVQGRAGTGYLTLTGNRLDRCRQGIFLNGGLNTIVSNNEVTATLRLAFLAIGTIGSMSIAGNHVRNAGFTDVNAYGLAVYQHNGVLEVRDNQVMNTGSRPDGEDVSDLAIGLLVQMTRECAIDGNTVGYDFGMRPSPRGEHRALLLSGLTESRVTIGNRELIIGYPATITGNHFQGPGRSALVEIREQRITGNLVRRFERVVVANNSFDHALDAVGQNVATLQIRGRRVVCSANDFKASLPVPSVNFNRVQATYLGNTAMAHPINFVGVPAVLAEFNLA